MNNMKCEQCNKDITNTQKKAKTNCTCEGTTMYEQLNIKQKTLLSSKHELQIDVLTHVLQQHSGDRTKFLYIMELLKIGDLITPEQYYHIVGILTTIPPGQ